MDDFIKGSRFVVIFHEDMRAALLAEDWADMLRIVKEEVCADPDKIDEWIDLGRTIHDGSEWTHDDFGPWHLRVDIGEFAMNLYRIWRKPEGGRGCRGVPPPIPTENSDDALA